MDIQNHFYGHSAALARYAGQHRARHIDGLLQHGWVASSPLAVNFGDFPEVGRGADQRRLLVWTHTSRAWSPDDEDRVTTPVGAPFLYLLRLLADQQQLEQVPGDGRPLVVPLHRTHVRATDSDPEGLSRFYRELLGPSTVCLHSEDLKQAGTVEAWRRGGHEVVSAGDRFDPLFLPRLARGVLASSRVVSNRLSTIVWYAAAAGVSATVFGPAPLIEGESRDALDRLTHLWPELHAEDAPLATTKPVADAELGASHLLSPGELARVLGWSHPWSGRAFGSYWMGGPVAKALTVVGLRDREASGTAVAATTVQGGPRPVDFLRHPLSHLPRRLPRLVDPRASLDWCRPA